MRGAGAAHIKSKLQPTRIYSSVPLEEFYIVQVIKKLWKSNNLSKVMDVKLLLLACAPRPESLIFPYFYFKFNADQTLKITFSSQIDFIC